MVNRSPIFVRYYIATLPDDPGARHFFVVGDASNKGYSVRQLTPNPEQLPEEGNVTTDDATSSDGVVGFRGNETYLRGENGTEYACQYAKAQLSKVRKWRFVTRRDCGGELVVTVALSSAPAPHLANA